MTYAQEKLEKDRVRAQRAPKFTFMAQGYDRFDRRQHTPQDGTIVVKTQPYGCPRNGTAKHCFIADAVTGQFIGLVYEGSLKRLIKI